MNKLVCQVARNEAHEFSGRFAKCDVTDRNISAQVDRGYFGNLLYQDSTTCPRTVASGFLTGFGQSDNHPVTRASGAGR
jgi:hypothetical protein